VLLDTVTESLIRVEAVGAIDAVTEPLPGADGLVLLDAATESLIRVEAVGAIDAVTEPLPDTELL